MSLRILSPIESTTASSLVHLGAAPSAAIFMDSSGSSSIIPMDKEHSYLWGTSATDKPSFLSTRHVRKQTITHTSSTAANYVFNSDGDKYPYIYFNGFFRGVGTAGASKYLLLRCGYSNGSIDAGANYQRRYVFNNGTSTTTGSTTANTGIFAGYTYSYSAVHLTNFTLFEGYGYIKSGAPRVFTVRYQYATSTVSNYVVDTTLWMNTAYVMTDLQVRVPANTNAYFNMSYWNP